MMGLEKLIKTWCLLIVIVSSNEPFVVHTGRRSGDQVQGSETGLTLKIGRHSQVSKLTWPTCLWAVGGNWSIGRKHTAAWGEHTDSAQERSGLWFESRTPHNKTVLKKDHFTSHVIFVWKQGLKQIHTHVCVYKTPKLLVIINCVGTFSIFRAFLHITKGSK